MAMRLSKWIQRLTGMPGLFFRATCRLLYALLSLNKYTVLDWLYRHGYDEDEVMTTTGWSRVIYYEQ